MLLLDKKSKKLLKFLIKQYKSGTFTSTSISKITFMSQYDIGECLKFLIEKSLLVCDEEDFGFGTIYKITKNGKIYFELRRKEILQSTLTPIIISIITTIITILIKDYLFKLI